jgi:hypothetical protein
MAYTKQQKEIIKHLHTITYECDCGWSGKINELYYREEYLKIPAALECTKCYTELVRL